jgi:hypothetical protein
MLRVRLAQHILRGQLIATNPAQSRSPRHGAGIMSELLFSTLLDLIGRTLHLKVT